MGDVWLLTKMAKPVAVVEQKIMLSIDMAGIHADDMCYLSRKSHGTDMGHTKYDSMNNKKVKRNV